MSDEKLIKIYVPIEKQEEAFKKLKEGYPVQYIIGNVDFYGNIINVNENVLIPRFETEYLVYKTINYINKFNIVNPNILEVGAGSGCISIALKKELDCKIDAIDISKLATDVAISNAKDNNVEINFIVEDIHNYKTNKLYDVIISNPPYVPLDSKYDKRIEYEPKDAIFAKDKGVYFYDIILKRMKDNLKDNYLIAFEIGDKEGILIKRIIEKYLPKAYVLIEKDYNNYERYVFISNNSF